MWYEVQGSAEGDRTVVMASGDFSGGMYEISGLTLFTTYTIEVAAVNSAGTGVYSDPQSVTTLMAGSNYQLSSIVYEVFVLCICACIHMSTCPEYSFYRCLYIFIFQVSLSGSWEWISPTTVMWTSLQWGMLWMAVTVYSATVT